MSIKGSDGFRNIRSEGESIMSQGLLIKEVLPDSLAAASGIESGFRIVSVNGNSLRDLIDLEFYQAEGEVSLCLEHPSGEMVEVFLEKDPDERLGIVLDPPRFAAVPTIAISVLWTRCHLGNVSPSISGTKTTVTVFCMETLSP